MARPSTYGITSMKEIEDELVNYRQQLQGQSVYLNCDQPELTNFWDWFALRFASLRLRKLSMAVIGADGAAYMRELLPGGVLNTYPLDGNGDFASSEIKVSMFSHDIVISEIDFGRFWECLSQMLDLRRKFIMLGNMSVAGSPNLFDLFMKNQVWLGYTHKGQKNWYTNLSVTRRNEPLILYRRYDPDEYPRYDNYDAIEVSEVKNIPRDYGGVMGVPTSFLRQYCPTQFELVGLGQGDAFTPSKQYEGARQLRTDGTILSSKTPNQQLMLLTDARPDRNCYTASDVAGFLIAPYARILIRRMLPDEES